MVHIFKDNQDLVKKVRDQDDLQKVKEATILEVKLVIEETIEEALDGTETDEMRLKQRMKRCIKWRWRREEADLCRSHYFGNRYNG